MPVNRISNPGEGSVLVDANGNCLVANTETVFNGAAQTASGNSSALDLSVYRSGLFVVNVSAVSGTSPTSAFQVQVLDVLSGKWVPIATPASVSAVTTLVVFMDESTASLPSSTGFTYAQGHPLLGGGAGSNYRMAWTIGGTSPSFTFTISFLGRPF